MKRCSVSLVLRKIRIKTTMRYNRTLFKIAKIKMTLYQVEDVEEHKLSYNWESKSIQPLSNTV